MIPFVIPSEVEESLIGISVRDVSTSLDMTRIENTRPHLFDQ
jgi:hypothetical protein